SSRVTKCTDFLRWNGLIRSCQFGTFLLTSLVQLPPALDRAFLISRISPSVVSAGATPVAVLCADHCRRLRVFDLNPVLRQPWPAFIDRVIVGTVRSFFSVAGQCAHL